MTITYILSTVSSIPIANTREFTLLLVILCEESPLYVISYHFTLKVKIIQPFCIKGFFSVQNTNIHNEIDRECSFEKIRNYS